MLTTSTIETQLAAAYPFTVDKLPLHGPDGLRTPHYGLFRSDTGECIGAACSRIYTPHQVDDVAALVEAAAGAFDGEARIKTTWRAGHFVSVVPSDEHRRSIFGTADNIFPRLIIDAGYDGSCFQASLGYYRDACRNLAMLRPEGAQTAASIKHTFSLREKLDDLRHVFRRLANGWETVAEAAREMDARQVDLTAFLREVYPMPEAPTEKTARSFDRRIEKIMRRIVSERYSTGRPRLEMTGSSVTVSAWEAFNAVQGYVQHDMPRKGRPDEMQRAITALRDPVVARALQLAMAG